MRMSFSEEEEDDDDFEAPLGSQFCPGVDGEIFYNLEASPSTKEELRRKLEEVDARSPSAKEVRVTTRATVRMRIRPQRTDKRNQKMDQVIKQRK